MTKNLIDVKQMENKEFHEIDEVDEVLLNAQLNEDIENKKIQSEQWWRKTEHWYKLAFNYNNPFTYGSVNPELELIWENRYLLRDDIENKTLVFFGLGVGETEQAIHDASINESSFTETIGIDVNKQFIEQFRNSLFMKSIETDITIKFCGIEKRFQDVEKEDISPENKKYSNNAFINLGNTIANIGEDLFKITGNLSKKGDILLISRNTPRHINTIYEKCSKNKYLPKLFLNYKQDIIREDINWKLEGNTISAEYKGIDVFRSATYTSQELASFAKNNGFRLQTEYRNIDNNHNMISIYEKR